MATSTTGIKYPDFPPTEEKGETQHKCISNSVGFIAYDGKQKSVTFSVPENESINEEDQAACRALTNALDDYHKLYKDLKNIPDTGPGIVFHEKKIKSLLRDFRKTHPTISIEGFDLPKIDKVRKNILPPPPAIGEKKPFPFNLFR